MNWNFLLKDQAFIGIVTMILAFLLLMILFSCTKRNRSRSKKTKILDFRPAFDKDGHMVYDICYIHPRYHYRTCTSLDWENDRQNLDDQVAIEISNLWIHPIERDTPNRTTVTIGVRVQAPESHQVLAVAFKWKEDGCPAHLTRFVREPNKKGVWESIMSSVPEKPSCRLMFSIVAIVLVGEQLYCYNRCEQWSYVS